MTDTWYVRPGGSGTRDGSSWGNALKGLPASLHRGSVYWLGAGSYRSRVFDDRDLGDRRITLRKASAEAHGTDVGWKPAYGSGQAVFGPLRFETSRYTIDGGEPDGLKIIGKTGTEAALEIEGDHVVLRRVEIDGGFRKAAGKQTAGSCNGSNVNGDYAVFDRCHIHNIADDGIGIYADHVDVLHSEIHDLDGCGTDGNCGPCYNGHSDGIELSGSTDVELVGNLVYDVRSNAALYMDDWSGSAVRDLVVYNNVFYAPDSGFAVYLQKVSRARVHNNVIWGKTQGSRYGGLSIGPGIVDLQMRNNIILNINFSHVGATQDARLHGLDYNLFGMVNADEYSPGPNDLVGDPRFAGVRMSSNDSDHRARVVLEDFVPAAREAIDTGTALSGVPARDIVGSERPRGSAWDRGAFESSSR